MFQPRLLRFSYLTLLSTCWNLREKQIRSNKIIPLSVRQHEIWCLGTNSVCLYLYLNWSSSVPTCPRDEVLEPLWDLLELFSQLLSNVSPTSCRVSSCLCCGSDCGWSGISLITTRKKEKVGGVCVCKQHTWAVTKWWRMSLMGATRNSTNKECHFKDLLYARY